MPLHNNTALKDQALRILAGYQVVPGTPDELMRADGEIRPVWAGLVAAINEMSADGLAQRIARGSQYLRDAGVFYRRYGSQGPSEREWPLSAMPVLIAEEEWSVISAGLSQRAELLERVVADLYGANTLVADGHLPPNLVADNPEW
ncbi:MAG: circularly permuted type 2 ATP-grasp protein, partial [Aestuariivirga sp.]